MLHIFNEVDPLLESLADLLVAASEDAIRKHGKFSFVLSGGSSPKRFYELLAGEKYSNRIAWPKVFFFFGDERYVPASDPQSNFLMAKKTLFDPLQISQDHIYPMDTTREPQAGARHYEEEIRSYFQGGQSCFDLTLLGLGDNSHTASLFPHTAILHEEHDWVKEVFVQELNTYRISLTYPIINSSQTIIFLVYGEGKASAVKHVIEDAADIEKYPAQLIRGENLHWFLDRAAASRLAK